MSEEEIITEIKDLIQYAKEELKAEHSCFTEESEIALERNIRFIQSRKRKE